MRAAATCVGEVAQRMPYQGQRAVDRLYAWRAAIVAGNYPSARRTRADLACFESRSVAMGNQVAPPGLDDHLRPGLRAQLRPNVAHVELYRFFGNHQLARHPSIRQSPCRERQHLSLPVREIVTELA